MLRHIGHGPRYLYVSPIMNTRSIDDNWMFDDVRDPDRKLIVSFDKIAANDIWRIVISSRNKHPMLLDDSDWPAKPEYWLGYGKWLDEWNSDDPGIPKDMSRVLNWNDHDLVQMLYHSTDVMQTEWHVFRRNWKCFLYEDEGPFLYNGNCGQVVQFHPIGSFAYGANQSLKGVLL